MRMLKTLEEYLEEIEKDNEWEYNFICDLMAKFEENPQTKLTQKQFQKLTTIYDKWQRKAVRKVR